MYSRKWGAFQICVSLLETQARTIDVLLQDDSEGAKERLLKCW